MKEEKVECAVYTKCGGCTMQNIPYEIQLKDKTNMVKKLVGNNITVLDTIGMDYPYGYRNKSKFVFGVKKGKKVMGFFEEGTHSIVYSQNCIIQNSITNDIANYVFELVEKYNISIYDEDRKRGVLRHLVIRCGVHTNEIMVILVTTDKKLGRQRDIVNDIVAKYPSVKTIVQNINEKQNSAVVGDKNIKLYGNGYIFDTLGEYKFKISPISFYQINSIQTEILYNKAIEFADLNGNEIVYDLYCGIGTISFFISKYVKEVYGVESVRDAIKDANENKKINRVNNVEFLVGRVEYLLPQLYNKTKGVDVVFVDPPRSGLDEKSIQTLLKIKPQKIVYISCNPETLARDLKILSNTYVTKKIQPIDMFPHTHHIECCTVLYKK